MDARILTHWKPSSYDRYTIIREFKRLLRQQGITEEDTPYSIEVRDPHYHNHWIADRGDAADWHRDNDKTQPDHLIVCWSNVRPTEIQDVAGDVFQAQPFEVVLMDNLCLRHRIPPGANKLERWFVRVNVRKTPKTLKILRGDD